MTRRRRHRGRRYRGAPAGGNSPSGRLALIPALIIMLMVVAFAVFGTTKARGIGAPFIFTLFGIGFAIMAISGFVSVVVSMINGGAPGTTASNDTEPAELYRPNTEEDPMDWQETQYRECTYCGTRVDRGVHRCPNCGAGI